MARAGVAVDAAAPGRPGGGGSRTCSSAGATLAGAEPWREKSGDGISLSTGHRAAELILGADRVASAATPRRRRDDGRARRPGRR